MQDLKGIEIFQDYNLQTLKGIEIVRFVVLSRRLAAWWPLKGPADLFVLLVLFIYLFASDDKSSIS